MGLVDPIQFRQSEGVQRISMEFSDIGQNIIEKDAEIVGVCQSSQRSRPTFHADEKLVAKRRKFAADLSELQRDVFISIIKIRFIHI